MSARTDNRPVTSFAWVENVDDYLRFGHAWQAGVIPVLAPPQSHRRSRWTGVLNWYGLGETEAVEVSSIQATVSDESDPMFVCDDQLLPPVQMYASFCGRPCYLVQNDMEIYDICDSHSCRSALIVDDSGRLTFDRILGFHKRLHVPWGLLTALDVPGLTFVVAKLIAGYYPSAKSFCSIDMLGRQLRVFGEEGPVPQMYEPILEYVVEVTSGWDWDAVALMAHGDSAHTYLESVILCGLPGAQEHGSDGVPIDGCRHEPNAEKSCKRAPSLGAVVANFNEIRAPEVYLFTCSGFCSSRQQYPSDVSSVLAASEGYAHTLLTTDGLTQIYQFSDYIAFGLRSKGARAGYVQTLFNDLAVRRSGRAPYVLWGDPRGSAPEWNTPDPAGTVHSSSADLVVPVRLAGLDGALILNLEGAEPETQLLRGERHAVIVRPHGSQGATYRLEDATERWAFHRSGLTSALRRISRAAWLERALRGLLDEHFKDSSALSDRITELMSLRLHLEFTVQSALTLSHRIHRQGTYDTQLERATESIAELMARWDRWFCEIVLEHLLSERYDRLLTDGCTEDQLSESGACNRCGSTVFEKRLYHPSGESWSVQERHCPICGYLGAWTPHAGRLHVKIPTSVSPGRPLEITMSLDEGEEDMWTARLKGEVAVKAHDGWCMGVFVATVERVDEWPHHLSVVVPDDMPLELMSLNFCCARALDVRFARVRCAAVPCRNLDENSDPNAF